MDFLTMLLQVTLIAAMAAPTSAQPEPGCQDSCGNVSIPYPFGTRLGCYYSKAFLVTCNTAFIPPKLFLGTSDIDVTNISVDGQLHILQFIAHDCYNESGIRIYRNVPSIWLSKFKISSTRNMLTAIGCDTRASIVGEKDNYNYSSGCSTICDNIDYVTNGSCSGIGCCQTSIPTGVDTYRVRLDSHFTPRRVWNFSPCSYAFVVEQDKFNFSSNLLRDLQKVQKLPVVLDWSIGDVNCSVAARDLSLYACKDKNSNCYDVDFGPGYRCNCSEGYKGNPYLPQGCEDIDECANPSLNQCEKICVNTAPNYTCSCPKGYHGDGRKDGSGCIPDPQRVIKIVVGIGMGILVLMVGCSSLYCVIRKRRLIKLKEEFFKRNGGLILLSKQDEDPSVKAAVKTFTIEEIQKATNHFDENLIVGQGGFGTVYKGVLPQNKTTVAIKKTLVVDKSQVDQFVNEVIVLSQIDQTNVVKLLGCCLEAEFPLLVYEFITNGTLSQHIHDVGHKSIPWEDRLRIAKETALALSHLHFEARIQVIHRDVKSTNILLDKNKITKVSDFGASRLVSLDKPLLSTVVQGTLGYLDPEYFYTSQLTDKSDVYSFGVVLAELLTGRMAISFDEKVPEKEKLLSTYFISCMNEKRSFLDDRITVNDVNTKQVSEVAKLAQCCLSLKGDERPPMNEVAKKLKELEENPEETDHLLGKSVDWGSTSTTVGDDSLKIHAIIPIDAHGGR
ncbi:wall-associated receptor kinase 3-like [Cornus florida]|uniref:wall-associated receptor kinase 3-like n=1 Tax=Cornus florida TaxID=4283 RepID=UPI00289EC944|nr:wall-associated receptor kinase 3-like [Cornus florida]